MVVLHFYTKMRNIINFPVPVRGRVRYRPTLNRRHLQQPFFKPVLESYLYCIWRAWSHGDDVHTIVIGYTFDGPGEQMFIPKLLEYYITRN